MTDYKPGTVAVATVRGVPDVRVIRDDRKPAWLSGVTVEGFQWHSEIGQVTDIRPLVVLDPEDLSDISDLVQRSGFYRPGEFITPMVSAVQKALRARVKSPRIPEPGLGVHVNAGKPDGTRAEFVRVGSRHWSEIGTGAGWEWSDLRDPVLVS